MAPPPKKGENFDPRYWSGWVETPSCSCPNEHKVAYRYAWIAVQMVSGATSGWQTTGRVLLGVLTLGITEATIDKKDLTHEAVMVWFECNKCGLKFAIQHEIINEYDGKVKNYGHYRNYEDLRESGTINRDFKFIQKCYDEMWQNYSTFGHNCYHWARDFCRKIRC